MEKISFFNRLGFKISALFILVILVGSLLVGVTTAFLAKQQFNALIKEQFNSTIAITENLITMVGQLALNWGNHFETDFEIINQIKNKNDSKLKSYVIDFIEESRADIVIILDDKNRILIHSGNQTRKNENLSSWNIVKQARQNLKAGTSILQDLNNMIIYSSVILQQENDYIGTILIGYELNDQFINNIKTNTNVDITIVRRRAVMASTFHVKDNDRIENIPVPYIQYQSQLNNPQTLGYMKHDNVEYFTAAKKLQLMEPSMEGSVLLSYPKQELDKIWSKLAFNLLGLFAIATIMVALISGRFSNILLTPLRDLQKYTNDIISGKSDEQLTITSGDEIALISENVNQLVTSISNKNLELDAYSNNLEEMVEERTAEVHLAHEELEKKEVMLSRAQLLAGMGSWVWELETDTVTCSDGVFKLLNLNYEKFDNKIDSFLGFFHKDDYEKISKLTYLKSVGDISHFDVRIRPEGYGHYINVHVELEVEVNDKGLPVRILGTLHDVTEQKKYEAALQEIAEGVSTVTGDEVFNTLTRYIKNTLNIDQAIIGLIQSPDFNKIKTISVYSKNKHIENTEYSLEGTPCFDVMHDVSYIYPEHVQQHYPDDINLKGFNAEGFAGVPISDSNGVNIGLVYVLDESPLDNPEKILSLLKIFSVRIASEIERKENEGRLLHVQKMEAITQLTGGVAHDFNNILASVLGYTELMKDEESIKGNEKLQKYLEQVYVSGARARDLVAQMLSYVRSKNVVSEIVNPAKIITDTTNKFRETSQMSIGITVDIEDDKLMIHADSVQLQQIIMNLLVNSSEAIDGAGNIIVSMNTVSLTDEHCDSCRNNFSGELIKITVQDTGKGISEEVMPRIFDPFFTSKMLGESTGMGLSMVHGMVHTSQGHITIDSSPGNGTTFNLFYPPAKMEG